MAENITLFMVSDNHFAVMLSVLLKSIEDTHHGNEVIDVYIINDHISPSNVQKINKTLTTSKINIFWRDIDTIIPANISLPNDKSTFPLNTYMRLCGEYFLPQSVKKVIYIDVDMLVLCDIRQLWDIDLNGHTIGAAVDREKYVSFEWGGIRNYKELGIPPHSKYFNAGMMLINLEKWKEVDATHSIFEIINKNAEFASFADQYGLNVFFANKWFEIDSKWNSFAQDDEIHPHIIHFTGTKPIFKGYDFNASYKELFFKYLALTPFKGFRPHNDYVGIFKKFSNLKSKKSWGYIFSKSIKYTAKRLGVGINTH